jgi:hypothetical protein
LTNAWNEQSGRKEKKVEQEKNKNEGGYQKSGPAAGFETPLSIGQFISSFQTRGVQTW